MDALPTAWAAAAHKRWVGLDKAPTPPTPFAAPPQADPTAQSQAERQKGRWWVGLAVAHSAALAEARKLPIKMSEAGDRSRGRAPRGTEPWRRRGTLQAALQAATPAWAAWKHDSVADSAPGKGPGSGDSTGGGAALAAVRRQDWSQGCC